MLAILIVGGVLVAVAACFVWAGRSETEARARRVGYRSGSMTPPRRDREDGPDGAP